jgi:protoheme IX farnesyltransferase
MKLRALFANYRELSKSGIVALVLISVLAGYLIGQPLEVPFSPGRMIFTLLGVLFLASGSSALNQWQEHEVDARMPRTAKRPIPSGRMSTTSVLVFVVITLSLGLVILSAISRECLFLGIAAVLTYNGFYTLWWKRRWAHAAVPGAVPGALPILIGYVASNGNWLSPGGWYVFLILFFWQMPHFWVLALRFQEDYKQGSFPTLPVALGESITVLQITLWCLAYVGLAMMAPIFLRTGLLYFCIALPISLVVLWQLRGFAKAEAKTSGKAWLKFFLWVNFSLIGYLAAAALDVWSMYLLTPYWTR